MTLIFRLYDDVDKGQFHCDGCGICRSGMIEYYKQCFVLCYSQFPIRGFLELYLMCHIIMSIIAQKCVKNYPHLLRFAEKIFVLLQLPVNSSCFMQCSSSDKLPPTETPYSASATGAVIQV